MKQSSLFCLGVVSLVSIVVLAGCTAPSFEYATVLDDGQKVRAEIVNGQAAMADTREVRLDISTYMIDPGTKSIYGRFAATMKDEFKPVAIAVEDVTNKPFVTLVDDTSPTFSPTGQWTAQTGAQTPDARHFEWLFTLSNSVRVFRLTFTAADGRKVVINQPVAFNGMVKISMREAAGIPEPK